MADQLRADYLSCYGHPHLQTPRSTRWRPVACASPAPTCRRRSAGRRGCDLYGPLCRLARVVLQRRAAARRRDDDGRPSAPARRAHGARRQDPHDRGSGRDAAPGRHPRHDRGCLRRRMRLRALRARRRPVARRGQPGGPGLQPLPARAGLRGREPVARERQCRAGGGGRGAVRLADAERAPAGRHRRRAFRDRLHDATARWTSSPRRTTSPGACT